MHPDLARLMDLQKLDLEAKRLRDEMLALPKRVADLDTKAKATVGQRALILTLSQKEDAQRRSLESDVKDRQAKITRLRKQLETATTAVQVTAWEHEIAFNQAEISKLEDAELESMERSEQFDAQKKLADEAVLKAEQTHAAERDRATETLARDKTALAAADTARTAQRKLIGEDALSLYDRIAKSKGTGIAEAWLQKCTACQMLLRPQKWNDLRERDNTERMTCDSCGRLLWYDPARDAPQSGNRPEPVKQESIAAQIVRGGR